jgi:phosphate transport system permease protein
MTNLTAPPEHERAGGSVTHGSTRDVWVDRAFRGAAFVAGFTVLAALALIAYSTTQEAWPAFKHEGLSFVTSDEWIPNEDKFGALAFIFGTLYTSFIAIVIAVPISLGIGLFTTELAPLRMRRPTIYVIDLLAAIPSVVYGLWGVLVLAPWIAPKYESVANTVGSVPVIGRIFAGPVSGGRGFMTAGLILAFMITPIVTALTRESLATVAQDDKNAALAMGATRWEMLRVAVFPRVRGGIVGAVMLGLGRAMGETIAVALVVGSSAQITLRVFSSGDTMAAVIANEFGEASGTHRAALIGLGVVLFLITIGINALARAVLNVTGGSAGGKAAA